MCVSICICSVCNVMYVCMSAVLATAQGCAVLGRDSRGVKRNCLLAVQFVKEKGNDRHNKIEGA